MNDTGTTAIDPTIAVLAEALASAEISAEAATSAHRAAEAARDAVRVRIQAMDDARRAIGVRRAEGDQRPEDGADLALLAVDQEMLVSVLAQRDADVGAARAEMEGKIRDLAQAKHGLEREEAVRTAAALDCRLEELGGLLLRCIGEANDVAKRLGRGGTGWLPPVGLMSALVPLNAKRRW